MESIETKAITDSSATPPEARFGESWLTARRFAIFLALLITVSFPGIVFGTATFIIRDFGLFSYPVAYFQRESFWRGELPFWNPLSACGVPFLAQWNTLPLYPFSLFYLVLPLSWALPMFCLGHLFWGGLGAYFLARSWTGSRVAAALAGVIFSFNGLTLNFLMWPSHIATFAWLPWVIWLVSKGWCEGGRTLVWATLASALQLLAGGPETIVVTWFILVLLGAGDCLFKRLPFRTVLVRFLSVAILSGLICAAQILPFMQLLANSQRHTGYAASAHDWTIPYWGWANLLVPVFRTTPGAHGVFFPTGQYWTSSYYLGIGTLLLGLIAFRRARDWRVILLGVLFFLSLVLAQGDVSPLFSALRACFPVLGFVRYPVKFVILSVAVAPLLAAIGLAAMARPPAKSRVFEWLSVTILLLLVGIVVAWDWNSVGADAQRMTWQNGLARAGLFILIAVVLVLRTEGWLSRRRILFGLGLLVVFWVDFLTHAPWQNPTVKPSVYNPDYARSHGHWNAPPVFGNSRALVTKKARELLSQGPLSDPAQNFLRNRLAARADCNLLDHVPQVDGFFSLVPGGTFRVLDLFYAQPDRDLSGLLDFLCVSQVIAPEALIDWQARPTAMPLITAGQGPIFIDDNTAFDTLLQTNTDLRHSVLLPPEARSGISATPQALARVVSAEFKNNTISFRADTPALSLFVIAQAYYPAWKAFVDGRKVKLWRANYAFQAIEVPAGQHAVRLVYQDNSFLLGAGLTVIGVVTTMGVWFLSRRRPNDTKVLQPNPGKHLT